MQLKAVVAVAVAVEDDGEKETVLKDAKVSSPGCGVPITSTGSEIICNKPFCQGYTAHRKSSLTASLIHVLCRPLS